MKYQCTQISFKIKSDRFAIKCKNIIELSLETNHIILVCQSDQK